MRRWRGVPAVDYASTRSIWALLVLIAPAAAWLRAVRANWEPEGDDATIVLRAREVAKGEFPLQGMRSTAGGGDPSLANHHLGPLELHLLMPGSLIGSGWVIALTCVAIVAVCSVSVVFWAHRIGGDPAVVIFGFGLLIVQCAVGPEAMFRPFNPYVGLVPIYFALVLLAAHLLRCGGTGWPLILTTGLIAQANLAFAPIGLGIAGFCVIVSLARVLRGHPGPRAWWARRRRLPQRHRTGRSRLARALQSGSVTRPHLGLLLTACVAVAVWAPVLVEPLRHSPGNIIQLAKTASADTPSQGLSWALSRLGLAAPVPGGFRPLGPNLVYEPSALAQLIGWLLLVALLIAALPKGVGRRRLVATLPARAGLVGLVLVVATLVALPTEGLANHYLAGIIPVTAFAWTAVVWRLALQLRGIRRRFLERMSLAVGAYGAAAAAVLLLVAPAPDFTGPHLGAQASQIVASRTSHLAPGTHVEVSGTGFLANLSTAPAVALQLERSGLVAHYLNPWPFSEDAQRLAKQFAPQGTLQVHLVGSDASERNAPPGSTLIGTVRQGPDEFIDVYITSGAKN